MGQDQPTTDSIGFRDCSPKSPGDHKEANTDGANLTTAATVCSDFVLFASQSQLGRPPRACGGACFVSGWQRAGARGGEQPSAASHSLDFRSWEPCPGSSGLSGQFSPSHSLCDVSLLDSVAWISPETCHTTTEHQALVHDCASSWSCSVLAVSCPRQISNKLQGRGCPCPAKPQLRPVPARHIDRGLRSQLSHVPRRRRSASPSFPSGRTRASVISVCFGRIYGPLFWASVRHRYHQAAGLGMATKVVEVGLVHVNINKKRHAWMRKLSATWAINVGPCCWPGCLAGLVQDK